MDENEFKKCREQLLAAGIPFEEDHMFLFPSDAMLDAMADALRKGEEVRLTGFGVFCVVDVPAREGRDPRTHAAIRIEAHKKIKFTPSQLIL